MFMDCVGRPEYPEEAQKTTTKNESEYVTPNTDTNCQLFSWEHSLLFWRKKNKTTVS